MNRISRIVIALTLNLFPGLGFYFSGTVHGLKWLQFLGIGLTATFLFLVPISAMITHPQPLIDYHFTASELFIPLAIALAFGLLGTGVEYQMKNEESVRP